MLALTQGDPAGIGPELLLRALAEPPEGCTLLAVGELAALEAVAAAVDPAVCERLPRLPAAVERSAVPAGGGVIDPVEERRRVTPGSSGPADAAGAIAAVDLGMQLVHTGVADALLTLPVSKASIATHLLPGFRGHTDYLAAACGLQGYGRDYLMAFLAPGLKVALLSAHLPLRQALEEIDTPSVLAALECLHRNVGGRIALAGLNPHAGEGGLIGDEEREVLAPAVREARRRGVDVEGPLSPDSLFARARGGAYDWVLALYHDQGLIAVKTASRGQATNWTLGLPFLRTSVDHGTAFDVAGRGVADDGPLRAAIRTTLELLANPPAGSPPS
ncbi:MAG TPA: 4-hydroxythreonine-4-phosphate dehydrogenase PdxA [Thermoanaerobaculia bacterium]|nr:4-hydroxythreonine-4-phosphate dehydrogenase PdxA [Thermoanaerobaculia bacterium]